MKGLWEQLDKLKASHDAERRWTEAKVAELGGGVLRIDEFGRWCCSYRPTRGGRRTRRLVARTGAALVEALERARAEGCPRSGGE